MKNSAKKITPEDKKKCWNCGHYIFKYRPSEQWAYCEFHTKWFGVEKKLTKTKCENWKQKGK